MSCVAICHWEVLLHLFLEVSSQILIADLLQNAWENVLVFFHKDAQTVTITKKKINPQCLDSPLH